VRSSLAKLDHVSNVETDCANRLCSFQADLDKVDVGVRLHELTFDNDKLKGWSLASMEPVTEETASASDVDQAAGAEGSGASTVPSAAEEDAAASSDDSA
jgi:hypothetical protein